MPVSLAESLITFTNHLLAVTVPSLQVAKLSATEFIYLVTRWEELMRERPVGWFPALKLGGQWWPDAAPSYSGVNLSRVDLDLHWCSWENNLSCPSFPSLVITLLNPGIHFSPWAPAFPEQLVWQVPGSEGFHMALQMLSVASKEKLKRHNACCEHSHSANRS